MVSSRVIFNSLSIVSGFIFVIIFLFAFDKSDFEFFIIGALVGPFLGGIACGFLLYRKDVKIIMLSFPFLVLGISILTLYLGFRDSYFDFIITHLPWGLAVILAPAALGSPLGYLFNLHKLRERKASAKQED